MTGRHNRGGKSEHVPHLFTCACGKRSYATRKEAKRVVRTMDRTTEPLPGKELNIYHCTLPGQEHLWHVGNRRLNFEALHTPPASE